MAGEKVGVIPQGEIMGRERMRHHKLMRGKTPEVHYSPRRSRVIMGINLYGDVVFIPLPGREWTEVDPAVLPHLLRGTENLFDHSKNSYATALRRKTTTSSVKTNKGDETHRPPKVSGFKFSSTLRDIAEERKSNEMKRRLLSLGIDADKLYLLLHTALHNQVLLERQSPKKAKKDIVSKAIRGRGGNEKHRPPKNFGVSSPFLEFEKKKKADKLKTSGTIYRSAK